MKRKIIVGVLMTSLVLPAMAFADIGGPDGGPYKGGIFERLDANKDGQLSFEEMTLRSTERFQKLDKDGNGSISIEEMTAMRKDFFDKLDKDGNGLISKEEAEAFRGMHRPMKKEKRDARMLKYLDADGNGLISMEEYETVSIKRFKNADTNGDGVISGDELSNLMPHKGKMHKDKMHRG